MTRDELRLQEMANFSSMSVRLMCGWIRSGSGSEGHGLGWILTEDESTPTRDIIICFTCVSSTAAGDMAQRVKC